MMRKRSLLLILLSITQLLFTTNVLAVNSEQIMPAPMDYYTAFFEAYDGTPAPVPQTVEEGGLLVKPTDPYMEGYEFQYWYYLEPGTNAPIVWDFDSDGLYYDLVLTAKYDVVIEPEPIVNIVEITGVVINEGNITLNKSDKTTYTATISPSNYTTTNPLVWQSSDPSIATVDNDGNVTSLKPGSTDITCQITDSDNNNQVWTSDIVTVAVMDDLKPILANSELNRIIVPSDIIAGKQFTFLAIGDSQNALGKIVGSEKYVPYSWKVNPSGEFTDGEPYTASTMIEKAGSYTLEVNFMLKRFDGNIWIDTDITDTKSIVIEVKSSDLIPKTGDDFKISILFNMLVSGLILIWMIKKRVKSN